MEYGESSDDETHDNGEIVVEDDGEKHKVTDVLVM
jgi:hypothetical protein